jgi:hypothetical protein
MIQNESETEDHGSVNAPLKMNLLGRSQVEQYGGLDAGCPCACWLQAATLSLCFSPVSGERW